MIILFQTMFLAQLNKSIELIFQLAEREKRSPGNRDCSAESVESGSWFCLVLPSGQHHERRRQRDQHLCFQLTSVRSNLRKLKSEKKIFKFYTNENGHVFYRTSEISNKLKVTYYSSKHNELPKTLTVSELNSSLSQKLSFIFNSLLNH